MSGWANLKNWWIPFKEKNAALENELTTAEEKRNASLKPDIKELLEKIDDDFVFYHEVVLFVRRYTTAKQEK